MPTSVSPKAQAAVAASIALLAAVATAYFGMRAAQSPSPASAAAAVATPPLPPEPPFNGPRTQEDAKQLLANLPEVKAWSSQLAKMSGGTVRGDLIRFAPTPRELNGKHFWQFSFVENLPEAARRWETFLVGEDTPEVLIDDLDNNTTMTLTRWRLDKQPMHRVAPASAVPAPAAPPTAPASAPGAKPADGDDAE